MFAKRYQPVMGWSRNLITEQKLQKLKKISSFTALIKKLSHSVNVPSKAALNTTVTEFGSKIPDITNLAAKARLTT